jgi:hypothetical protein
MASIEEIREVIAYVRDIMAHRDDKEKFIPLLKRLKAEYDDLMSVDDLMDFANEVAFEERNKKKPMANNNVVRLRKVA